MKLWVTALFFVLLILIPPTLAEEGQEITVNVVEDQYSFGSAVIVEITILSNNVSIGGELKYSLVDPNGFFPITIKEQIPYLYKGETIFIKNITLPSDADPGEWKVFVRFGNYSAEDTFAVMNMVDPEYTLPNYFWVIIIIIAGFIYSYNRETKK